MADTTGFLKHARREIEHRPLRERVRDFQEVNLPLPQDVLVTQASRCMDCGIPFCHGAGCPVQNRIPEFNDLIYRGRWREASENLHSTNNFPEITGRVCPAPCEASCTLNINDDPVLIKHIEQQIVERAWREGWITPLIARRRTGRRVAIVGSGPAGLAAAQQLARSGHDVVLFEKSDRIGGLLRYGIPEFKLDKRIIDRRLEQMRAEGVQFHPGVTVGEDVSVRYLKRTFDAVLLAMGATEPRDLNVEGRELANVHFAMDFLTQQNRINAGDDIPEEKLISAKDRCVVVIGGGDTGSDCVGTAIRQGAREVHQFEILPEPPKDENPETPWPLWPRILRTSTSHEEGCQRRWSVLTKSLTGRRGSVEQLHGVEVRWAPGENGPGFSEVPGTEFSMKVDLVLLAMGFVHVEHGGLIESADLECDKRGNLTVGDDYRTNEPDVFAAGDTVLGASLVVRAIYTGRQAGDAVDRHLRG